MAAPWMVTLRGPYEVHPVRFEGPLIRMGGRPGPGGVLLHGGEGLLDHHCTLMVHPCGEIELVPLPGGIVRVSPYLPGDWREVPPLRQPVFIDRGAYLCLGSSHEGCVQFMNAWVPIPLMPPQLSTASPSRVPGFVMGMCAGGLLAFLVGVSLS